MATTTTCSRRMIKVKGGMMKKMNKPHAPLPRQRPPSSAPSGDEQMIGEEAKAVEFKAPVRRAPPPPTWWQKAMKPAGIAFGVLACAGIGYFISLPSKPAYDRSAEVAAAAPTPSSPGRSRSSGSQAYPGSDQITGPIDLSARSGPTAQSFQASAYVRKKVRLESASGDCVVKSGYDRVTDCVQ